jgi:hypothetical protein
LVVGELDQQRLGVEGLHDGADLADYQMLRRQIR